LNPSQENPRAFINHFEAPGHLGAVLDSMNCRTSIGIFVGIPPGPGAAEIWAAIA